MKVFRAYDPEADTDFLVTIHDDGSGEFATRPGRNRRWVTWSPPIALTAEVAS